MQHAQDGVLGQWVVLGTVILQLPLQEGDSCTYETLLVVNELVCEPLVQLEVLPTGSQNCQLYDEEEVGGVEQLRQGLQVLCHIQDAGQPGLVHLSTGGLVMHVVVAHGVQHELLEGCLSVLGTGPAVVQDDGGVGVVPEERLQQRPDHVVLERMGVKIWDIMRAVLLIKIGLYFLYYGFRSIKLTWSVCQLHLLWRSPNMRISGQSLAGIDRMVITSPRSPHSPIFNSVSIRSREVQTCY